MTVAVLALQGAFAEHENVLKRLGVDCIELRQAKDLETPYDGIILPGGESTVQGKLLKELGMFDTIKEQIENGMPVLATCAGLILLASEVDGQEGCHFGTIPMCVRRNAYGCGIAIEHSGLRKQRAVRQGCHAHPVVRTLHAFGQVEYGERIAAGSKDLRTGEIGRGNARVVVLHLHVVVAGIAGVQQQGAFGGMRRVAESVVALAGGKRHPQGKPPKT